MQLVAPWIQERKIFLAKHRYVRNHALHRVHHYLTKENNWGSLYTPMGEPDEEVLKKYVPNSENVYSWIAESCFLLRSTAWCH